MDSCALALGALHHRREGDAGDTIGEQLNERSECRAVLKAHTAEASVENIHIADGATCSTCTTDNRPLEWLIHSYSIAGGMCDFLSVLVDATNLIAVDTSIEG
eukprot:scaffold87637_cov29-Tisochrysis_lutea.AAC.1